MSIDEYLAQLDSVRRSVGRNALATVTDPVNHLNRSLSRYAHENLPTNVEMEDARSVMPGMGDAAAAKINALAMNALGAGIFAGRGAKTADLLKLARAEEMTMQGLPREKVWQETGWFVGPDKRWKFEIPDDVSRMRQPTFGHPDYRPAADVMKHEDLFAAYPDIAKIPTKVETSQMMSGSYDPWPHIDVRGPTPPDVRSVMLHELQHGVQSKEGFARGGSPLTAHGMIQQPIPKHYEPVREALNILAVPYTKMGTIDEAIAAQKPSQQAIELAKRFKYEDLQGVIERAMGLRNVDAYDAYKRLAGEAESRAVQARRDFTPEQRRSTFPAQSYDTPWDQLFVRY